MNSQITGKGKGFLSAFVVPGASWFFAFIWTTMTFGVFYRLLCAVCVLEYQWHVVGISLLWSRKPFICTNTKEFLWAIGFLLLSLKLEWSVQSWNHFREIRALNSLNWPYQRRKTMELWSEEHKVELICIYRLIKLI